MTLSSTIQQGTIEVFNTIGACVYQQPIAGYGTIHVPALAKGFYFVKLNTGTDQSLVKKVIVQ